MQIAGHATAIFRRACTSTGNARWIVAVGIGWQNGFNFYFVEPVIAKVVYVQELVSFLQIKKFQLGFSAPFIDDFIVTIRGVGIAVSFATDLKFMQMAILPAEGTLYAFMDLLELCVSGQKEAAPNRRRNADQRHFHLKYHSTGFDRERRQAGILCEVSKWTLYVIHDVAAANAASV